VFHVRQRWGAAIWRAQTQVLLGRLKQVRSARVGRGRVETCGGHSGGGQQLPAAGRTLVGLVLEASTQTAGESATAATWVAPTGTPAVRALCGGRTSCGCVDTTEPARAGSAIFWEARCAAFATPPQKTTRVWGSIGSAQIFAEGTAHTTTKRDVKHAGLARYRQGVVGGWLMELGVHAGEWSALPCGSAAPPRGTGLSPCKHTPTHPKKKKPHDL
jgi:hypothetical protein